MQEGYIYIFFLPNSQSNSMKGRYYHYTYFTLQYLYSKEAGYTII